MEETLAKFLEKIDKRFDDIDKRLDGMDKRFDTVDKRLDGLQNGQEEIKVELRTVNRKLDTLYEQVAKNAELEAKFTYRLKKAFADE